MKLLLYPFLVWNLWILGWWISQFHVAPWTLRDAFNQYFLQRTFSGSALIENWTGFALASISLLGATGIARRLGLALGRLVDPAGSRDILLTVAFGICIIGSITFAFGLTGLLFTPPRLAALAVLALSALAELKAFLPLCYRLGPSSNTLRYRPNGWPSPASRPARLLADGGFLIMGLALSLAALTTVANVFNIEMSWDALTYHLRLPTFYLYRHKFFDVWHHLWSYFPEQIEMLYAFAQIAHGDSLVRLLNASFGLLLLLATQRLARQLSVKPGWPLLLVAASPVFLILIARAYVDLAFAFILLMSLGCFIRWWKTGSSSALVSSALLAGWGMGCKYTGILFPLAIFAAAAPRLHLPVYRRAAAMWNVVALIPLAPWLVKNWVYRGNPVFPFLGGLFGEKVALPSEMSASPFQADGVILQVIDKVATSAKATFLSHGHVDGPNLAVVAGLVPLLLWLPRRDDLMLSMRRAVVAYTLGWFAIHPDSRFFLPMLPALLILLAASFEPFLARAGAWRTSLIGVLGAGIVAGAIYAASVQWVFFGPFTLVLGLHTAQEKLAIGIPIAPFMHYVRNHINTRVPARSRILYACHFSTYYVERECIADFHFGESHLTRLLKRADGPESLARALKQRGIGWILSTGSLTAGYLPLPGYFALPEKSWHDWKRFLATRTEVDFQTDQYTLFRVVDPHPPRPLPALPVYETVAFAAADQALGNGRIQDALSEYTHPPSLLRDIGSTYVRQGDAFLALGNVVQAREAFRRALSLGSDNPRVRTGLAQIHLRTATPEDGLPHARSAWSQNPLSAYAAATLSLTYKALGRRSDALQLIEEARRLRPDVVDYRRIAVHLKEPTGP